MLGDRHQAPAEKIGMMRASEHPEAEAVTETAGSHNKAGWLWYSMWDVTTPPLPGLAALLAVLHLEQRRTLPLVVGSSPTPGVHLRNQWLVAQDEVVLDASRAATARGA